MNIVLFATGWGSEHGGINAFNHGFATGLAQTCPKGARIFCVVEAIDKVAQADADSHGIELIATKPDTDGSMRQDAGHMVGDWLARYSPDCKIDIWVGHDVTTGWAAMAAQRRMGGQLALILHMAYHSYKNIAGGAGQRTAELHDDQERLFGTEDTTLFGVGSDLAEFGRRLAGKSVTTLIPGFPEPHASNNSGSTFLEILVSGRFDAAAEPVKQGELAAEALGEAIRQSHGLIKALERPSVMIFGVGAEKLDEGKFEKLLNERAGQYVNCVPRGFTTDRNSVQRELSRSNLSIMPSLREGFGLVGWEAIGCEVPLILGKSSGLYRTIETVLPGTGPSLVNGVDIKGGPARESDIKAVADVIIEIAKDVPAAKTKARKLRAELVQGEGCTWIATAQRFLAASGHEVRHARGAQSPAHPIRSERLHGHFGHEGSRAPPGEDRAALVRDIYTLATKIKRPALVPQIVMLLGIPPQQRPNLGSIEADLRAIELWAEGEGRLPDLKAVLAEILTDGTLDDTVKRRAAELSARQSEMAGKFIGPSGAVFGRAMLGEQLIEYRLFVPIDDGKLAEPPLATTKARFDGKAVDLATARSLEGCFHDSWRWPTPAEIARIVDPEGLCSQGAPNPFGFALSPTERYWAQDRDRLIACAANASPTSEPTALAVLFYRG